MSILKTKYMGLELKSPIIAGASELTSNIDNIKKLEEAGAGAIIIKSLFQEEIELERFVLEHKLEEYSEIHPEMLTIFPKITHAGPQEHLMWVKKAKENTSIPIIASLNAKSKDIWIEYSKKLEDAGVDGLELNIYHTPLDFEKSGQEIEDEQVEIVSAVKDAVSIPISVKLSPFYSNPLNVIKRFDSLGVDAFVLFNKFFPEDIDPYDLTTSIAMYLSAEQDLGISLKYTALLYGNLKSSLCGSWGITESEGALKLLLAGSNAVQVVSALYHKGIPYISVMNRDIERWMNEKGFSSIEEFSGKLSKKNVTDPFAYERNQYVKLLMNPNILK